MSSYLYKKWKVKADQEALNHQLHNELWGDNPTLDRIKQLVKQGADINSIDWITTASDHDYEEMGKYTLALHTLLTTNPNLPILKLFLEKDIDLTLRDSDNNTIFDILTQDIEQDYVHEVKRGIFINKKSSYKDYNYLLPIIDHITNTYSIKKIIDLFYDENKKLKNHFDVNYYREAQKNLGPRFVDEYEVPPYNFNPDSIIRVRDENGQVLIIIVNYTSYINNICNKLEQIYTKIKNNYPQIEHAVGGIFAHINDSGTNNILSNKLPDELCLHIGKMYMQNLDIKDLLHDKEKLLQVCETGRTWVDHVIKEKNLHLYR